jgi:hypothetical protein
MDARATLQDTQAALAAALAKIEALRVRQKQLIDELAGLRKQVHGGGEAPATAPADQPQAAAPAAAAATDGAGDKEQASPSACKQLQAPFTALGSDMPLYVSTVDAAEQMAALCSPGGDDKVGAHVILPCSAAARVNAACVPSFLFFPLAVRTGRLPDHSRQGSTGLCAAACASEAGGLHWHHVCQGALAGAAPQHPSCWSTF